MKKGTRSELINGMRVVSARIGEGELDFVRETSKKEKIKLSTNY